MSTASEWADARVLASRRYAKVGLGYRGPAERPQRGSARDGALALVVSAAGPEWWRDLMDRLIQVAGDVEKALALVGGQRR